MSRSDRLRLRDIIAAQRLVGECRELGRDPRAWRLHLLGALRRLTGAQVALHLHLHLHPCSGEAGDEIAEPLDAGFLDPEHRLLWGEYQRQRAHRDDPFHVAYFRGFTGALRTRRLEAVVERAEWQRSRHYNEFVRACGLEDRITSSFRLEAGTPRATQVIVLHRAAADGAFPARAPRLVQLVQRELKPLIGRNLASNDPAADYRALSPQLRRVLCCLLQGDSEKQAALRLGISRHTVDRHVQRLHSRFGVHSRGELLHRCRDALPLLEDAASLPPARASTRGSSRRK